MSASAPGLNESKQTIVYTLTDEAPALSTASLLPIIEAFTAPFGIKLEQQDISLAARIVAAFPEFVDKVEQHGDPLSTLSEIVRSPTANVIKLPNISATATQLIAAVEELRLQGHNLPRYPLSPGNQKEQEVLERYRNVMGSAVNPVLRDGNSQRWIPQSIKRTSADGTPPITGWSSRNRSRVSSMKDGDFYGSESSTQLSQPVGITVEFVGSDGRISSLGEKLTVSGGEIVDTAVMSIGHLRRFLREAMSLAKREDLLFSLNLKATMMKVSDPVIFGEAVSILLERFTASDTGRGRVLKFEPQNGLGGLIEAICALPTEERDSTRAELELCLKCGPELAMIDPGEDISGLHSPNLVIIDSFMANLIRRGGLSPAPDGSEKETLVVIPDRTYSSLYQRTIEFLKEHGELDPATLGSMTNIGIMAYKAEEYGSHGTTFISPSDGKIRVVASSGEVVAEHTVDSGDIFRLSRLRSEAVESWVGLALDRAKSTGSSVVFWLDPDRPHDRLVERLARQFIPEADLKGADIRFMPPGDATAYSLKEMVAGRDIISATGNVLRDYITDLFPILEVGTSATMMSAIALMKGGTLLETGSGGSAPKHVEQFLNEGHLRWNSMGEFLALHASFEALATRFGTSYLYEVTRALGEAIATITSRRIAPSRKCGELDTRGTHYYLALFWAEALSNRLSNPELKRIFLDATTKLESMKARILKELEDAQGSKVIIGGYYHPDPDLLQRAMRPSTTFNSVIQGLRDLVNKGVNRG